MELANQIRSLRRWLHIRYPDPPIYLEEVPQDFVRPSFHLAAGRALDQTVGVSVIESRVPWDLTYFATSREEAEALRDGITRALLDPGLVPYIDWSSGEEVATPRYLRVQNVEHELAQDDAGAFSVLMVVATTLRLPRATSVAAAMADIKASPNIR